MTTPYHKAIKHYNPRFPAGIVEEYTKSGFEGRFFTMEGRSLKITENIHQESTFCAKNTLNLYAVFDTITYRYYLISQGEAE